MPKIDLSKVVDLRQVKFNEQLSGSSDGILTKTRINSSYIKLGSYSRPYGFYGIEPVMEIINSRIGDVLNLPVLRYGLVKCIVNIDGADILTLASVSTNYVPKQATSVSVEKFCETFQETPLRVLERYGLLTDVYKQFLYDFIILNMDRHGKNTELLVFDNGALRVAPFFDNSLTFIFNRPENEVKKKVLYNDAISVNNYIGDRNLQANLLKISHRIEVRCPRDTDRAYIFQGLSKVTSRSFRDYVWYMLLRRIDDVRRQKIQAIVWR